MKMKRYLSLLLAGTLALALTACGGSAKTDPGTSDQPSTSDENWTPKENVTMIVSYKAGSGTDNTARVLAAYAEKYIGKPVIIENLEGGSGSIGWTALSQAAPDGYTLGFAAVSPLALNPHLGKSPFDPQKDIAPVVSVMYSPVLLLGTPASRATDFKDLIARARAQPGTVRWATSGQASLGHIMLEQIQSVAQVQITHIPYKGGGQQMNDALGGQFEVLSTNAGPAVLQHIQAGKLKPLAVGAPARLDSLPQVPTLAELGYKNANTTSVFGIFAPSGVPAAVLARLNAEVNKALALPEIRQRLEATDNVPTGGKAADFAKQIEAESRSNAQIIKAAGIQTN